MAEHFDELTKALASGVSRRDALKRFVGGLFGGLLAAVGLGKTAHAQAAGTCPEYCLSLGLTPGAGNAFGKCVSNCAQCRDAGGVECGASGCCTGGDACEGLVCVTGCEACVCPCSDLEPCGTNPGAVLGNCYCFPTTEHPDGGDLVGCSQDFICGSTDTCSSSDECPAGWVCTTNTCCEDNRCAPLCDTVTTGVSLLQGSGPRASGGS